MNTPFPLTPKFKCPDKVWFRTTATNYDGCLCCNTIFEYYNDVSFRSVLDPFMHRKNIAYHLIDYSGCIEETALRATEEEARKDFELPKDKTRPSLCPGCQAYNDRLQSKYDMACEILSCVASPAPLCGVCTHASPDCPIKDMTVCWQKHIDSQVRK